MFLTFLRIAVMSTRMKIQPWVCKKHRWDTILAELVKMLLIMGTKQVNYGKLWK